MVTINLVGGSTSSSSILIVVSIVWTFLSPSLANNVIIHSPPSSQREPRATQPQYQKYQLDSSLEHWVPPVELSRKFPYYLAGYDDEERPIWIVEFGKWNIRSEVEMGGDHVRNLSRYIDQAFWRLSRSIELRSTPEYPVTDGVGIFDMADYSLWQLASVPTLQFIFQKGREIEPTTPHMERGFFLNVGFVEQTLLNFLKPVLGTFLAKSDIYGTNRARWIPDIVTKLPRESLPEWYGGYKNFRPVAVYG